MRCLYGGFNHRKARAVPGCRQRNNLPDHLLRVRFLNGELRDFDMKPLLTRKCYLPLKNDILFQTATVTFGTVQWANGLDLDPEWLYKDSVPVQ